MNPGFLNHQQYHLTPNHSNSNPQPAANSWPLNFLPKVITLRLVDLTSTPPRDPGTKKNHRRKAWIFRRNQIPRCFSMCLKHPKIPCKGTISKGNESSSNHQFSGDLLLFEGVKHPIFWSGIRPRWRFQSILKMLVKLDHFPRDRGENKKYLKPPPRYSWLSPLFSGCNLSLRHQPGWWHYTLLRRVFLKRFQAMKPSFATIIGKRNNPNHTCSSYQLSTQEKTSPYGSENKTPGSSSSCLQAASTSVSWRCDVAHCQKNSWHFQQSKSRKGIQPQCWVQNPIQTNLF